MKTKYLLPSRVETVYNAMQGKSYASQLRLGLVVTDNTAVIASFGPPTYFGRVAILEVKSEYGMYFVGQRSFGVLTEAHLFRLMSKGHVKLQYGGILATFPKIACNNYTVLPAELEYMLKDKTPSKASGEESTPEMPTRQMHVFKTTLTNGNKVLVTATDMASVLRSISDDSKLGSQRFLREEEIESVERLPWPVI